MKRSLKNMRSLRSAGSPIIELLEGRKLLSSSCYAVALTPPSTPVSTYSVDIEPAAHGARGVTIKTISNGGAPVTTSVSRVPSEIDIFSPQVPGRHDVTVTIGNLNTMLNVTMPDNSSDTTSVTTAGASVTVTAGNNGANFINVLETATSSCFNEDDDIYELPVEINGGSGGLNQISLTGSGLIHGGVNASNQVTGNGGEVVFFGGDGSSNIFSGGSTGQYFLFGATNSFNSFSLNGGFNYVVGGDTANNLYTVADAGSGVIIFGQNAGNTILTQSANSLKDYLVITDPKQFHCRNQGFGDQDDDGGDDHDGGDRD